MKRKHWGEFGSLHNFVVNKNLFERMHVFRFILVSENVGAKMDFFWCGAILRTVGLLKSIGFEGIQPSHN